MSDDAERLFDEVTEYLVRELPAVRGGAGEHAVIDEAARRYVAARLLVDPDDPAAYASHFFGADGVGFEKSRTPALQRIEGLDGDEIVRLCAAIDAAADQHGSQAG